MRPSLLRLTHGIARRFSPRGGRHRRGLLAAGAIALAAALAFLVVPALAGVPQRLSRGCGRWLALAAVFELLSALGFVVIFKLVFAASTGWRASSRAGLCVLGASTVLPAGGLLGAALGARMTRGRGTRRSARSTAVAFVLLTNAPGVLLVTLLGIPLGFGWIGGPHAVSLTVGPAVVALALVAAVASLPFLRGPLFSRGRARPAIVEGVREAEALIGAGDWKLLGALAYFAFDNAALWAAFRAFGHSPSFGVLVMAYLLGGIAGALPLPAGVGGVEAGLIGSLVLYGTPAAAAAAAVLVYRGVSLAVPVILGAGALVDPRHGLAVGAAAPRVDPPDTSARSTYVVSAVRPRGHHTPLQLSGRQANHGR